jgi:sigma-B regulation protein RsbU (phosphoserine phosphatase)
MILTVISPSHERHQVRVDRSPFRIGRLVDRELSLGDSRISRNHAQILEEDGVHYIEDCDSRHGVFVNGRRVQRARLRLRDRIDFGIEDSYALFVGDDPVYSAPLLKKVAELSEGQGNLGRLSAVLDVARALQSSGSVDDVLSAAVDAALSLTGAERGFLMLHQPDGTLGIRVARDREGQVLASDSLQVPHTLIDEALKNRAELFAMSFDPAADAEALEQGRTVMALELRSVVCVPLVRISIGQENETSLLTKSKDTLGVLYMDTREIGANLAEGNRELLQSLGIEISTVLENARLLGESRQRHDLEQELQIAREIQQALLPAKLPTTGWFSASGSSEACFQVGGDYYDVIKLDDETWGVVLADVSGKGVSAALMSSLLQGAFFAATASSENLPDAVSRINRYISERSRNARFTTAFCGIIRRDGSGHWVNAGHCPGLVARCDSSIDWLQPTAVPIGLFPDAVFPAEDLQLIAGDRLVLYSDGVSEAANASKDRFGEARLADYVKRSHQLSVQELHDGLMDEINAFTQGEAQSDDLTLLVIGYQG